jgi:hypothetical protein
MHCPYCCIRWGLALADVPYVCFLLALSPLSTSLPVDTQAVNDCQCCTRRGMGLADGLNIVCPFALPPSPPYKRSNCFTALGLRV